MVLAMGSRNYDPLSETVKEIVKDTFVIGDAIRARRALNATVEALDVAGFKYIVKIKNYLCCEKITAGIINIKI